MKLISLIPIVGLFVGFRFRDTEWNVFAWRLWHMVTVIIIGVVIGSTLLQ